MKKHNIKVLQKRQQSVVQLHLELYVPLNNRLEEWCITHGWSKRKVIEDAIHCWLNQRDQAIADKGDKV